MWQMMTAEAEPLLHAAKHAAAASPYQNDRWWRHPVMRELRHDAGLALGAGSVLVTVAVLEGVQPLYFGRLTDGTRESLVNYAALSVFMGAGAAARNFLFRMLGLRANARLARALVVRLMDLPVSVLDAVPSAALSGRVDGDVSKLVDNLQLGINVALRTVVRLTVNVGVLFSLQPACAVFIAIALPASAACTRAMARLTVRPRAARARESRREALARVHEAVAGARTVRALAAEVTMIEGVRHALAEWRTLAAAEAAWNAFAFYLPSLYMSTTVFVGAAWMARELDARDAAAVILFVSQMANTINDFAEYVSNSERGADEVTLELLRSPEPFWFNAPAREPGSPVGAAVAVQFKNVCFGYAPKAPLVLDNFNLAILPGEKVAVVGPSGAGKSTIHALLMGFYEAWRGDVRIDGMLVKRLRETGELRSLVAAVAQEPVLFRGSVVDNVLMGAPPGADAQTAAYAAGCASLLGIGEVGEHGSNLSGGQKQRVAVARALVRNPVLLLADEPCSALDEDSETRVLHALQQTPCSVVLSTHRRVPDGFQVVHLS